MNDSHLLLPACRRIILAAVFAWQFSVGAAGSSPDVSFYIALNGNDAWSGKLPEPAADASDGPLATLDAARSKVRKQVSQGVASSVSVLIRGGEYALDSTIVFTHRDSGTKTCPVTYRAYPGERPVFTGGQKLTGWKKVTEDPERVSDAARGTLWSCEIPADLRGTWRIKTLYDGLTLLPRSRSGKFKAAPSQILDPYNAQPKDVRGLDWDAEPVTFSRELRYRGNDLKAWDHPSDIEILIRPKHGWLVNLLPLDRIDAENKAAYFAVDATYGIRPNNPYQIENALEYLDEPGEWVFDSGAKRIYIWPENPLAEADIRAPFLQEFIRVEGIEDRMPARFLHFEGLTFRHGLRDTWKPGDKGLQHDWDMYDKGNAVMRFRHAEACSVRRCTFEASSGGGVRLDLHCQRIAVADSIFAHLGGTGILLSGYAPGTKDENKFNTVTNNVLHHTGAIYLHSPGIFVAQSGHNLIRRNTIHDLAYNGMVISGCRPHELVMAKVLANRREWVSSIRVEEIQPYIKDITPEMVKNWIDFDVNIIEPLLHARENRIEENEIYAVMQKLHDGNGIYFSGMGKNNVAERNYLHDITTSRGYIRLDDISAYTRIVHNVGHRGARMFQIKGPAEIRNNFAIDTIFFLKRRYASMDVVHNIFYNTTSWPATHENTQTRRHPEATWTYDLIDRWSNSLLFDQNRPEGIPVGEDLAPPERRGAAVGLLVADPLFDEEAMKQKIFRFKPGSPAEQLGIQPINLSDVGSTLAR